MEECNLPKAKIKFRGFIYSGDFLSLNRFISPYLYLPLIVLLFINLGYSQWAKGIGSEYHDSISSITVDINGNVYVTGYFSETVDFDPDPGIANLTTNDGIDIFFAKYNSNGEYIFAKSIGSENGDVAQHIKVDESKNIYLSGYFSGTADFDPGSETAVLTQIPDNNSPGLNPDIFFAKYTSNVDTQDESLAGYWMFDDAPSND